MQEPTVVHSEPAFQPRTHIVHVLMQFALAVRHRKYVLVAAVVVACLLGGLYYGTATRYYAARASLLVLDSGSDISETTLTPLGSRHQGLMPTYENLVSQTEVLKGALKLLTRPEDRVDLADVPQEKRTDVLRRNLTARAFQNTNVIRIEYKSKDPSAAVSVVNAVVHSYLTSIKQIHQGTAIDNLQVLEAQYAELDNQIRQNEAALNSAKMDVGLLDGSKDSSLPHPVMQRAADFNQELIETQKQIAQLEGTLYAVEAAFQHGQKLDQALLYDVEEVVGKEMMLALLGFNTWDASHQAAMKQELLEAKSRLEDIKPHFGRAHPEYRATVGKIRGIEEYLSGYQIGVKQKLAEIQRDDLGPMLLNMLHQKLTLARSCEAAQAAQWQEVYGEATRLQRSLDYIKTLSSDTEVLRTQREGLVQQIGDVKLKHDGADMRATVMSHPTRIDQPVSPNLRRVALMALIAGLAMGLLAVYVLDILDDRFRSAEEMQAQLRAPVLSMVRQLKVADRAGLESLQVYSQPDAPESEAFRTLRTALSLGDQPAHRMVITSAEPGDGKTTVLANLAVSFAQSDKRTLLIDADLRRPGLTATLGLKGSEGLSNIIRGAADVAGMATSHIRASGVEGLDVLSSGPRPSNPGELLSSPRFADLLGWAETLYDRILIDSPPALAASDTAIIGRLVDGAMLVVQPEKNRRRLVIRAAESLTVLRINVLGVVINRVCSEKDGGYYGYDSGYHYDYGYGTEPDPHEEQAGLSERYVDDARSESDAVVAFSQTETDRQANIVPRRRIA